MPCQVPYTTKELFPSFQVTTVSSSSVQLRFSGNPDQETTRVSCGCDVCDTKHERNTCFPSDLCHGLVFLAPVGGAGESQSGVNRLGRFVTHLLKKDPTLFGICGSRVGGGGEQVEGRFVQVVIHLLEKDG